MNLRHLQSNLRRPLVLAAALPSLFLFKEIFSSLLLSSAEISSSSTSIFDARFTGRTMRVDLFHTGGPKGEVVALDRCVDDGPWPGSRTRLLDETNLGSHFVRGARRPDEPRHLLARLFVDVQRVGADGGGEASRPDVPRVAAASLAAGEGPGRPRAPRQGERLPRAVLGRDRPRGARGEPRAAGAARARSGRSSRTAPPRRSWTSSSSARATPRRTCRSSTPT